MECRPTAVVLLRLWTRTRLSSSEICFAHFSSGLTSVRSASSMFSDSHLYFLDVPVFSDVFDVVLAFS